MSQRQDLGERAHALTETDAFETVARVGYGVRGLVNVLLGVIVVRVALGARADEAEQSSALEQVAGAPFGRVALVVGVVGLLALGLERLTESVWGTRDLHGWRRGLRGARTAAKGAVYLALSVVTASVAVRGRGSGSQQTVDLTAVALHQPGGRLLVGAVGLGVLGVAGYLVDKGVRRRFLTDLAGGTTGDLGRVTVVVATVGYVAKGVAYGIVGVLVVVAAVQADPTEARGTAGAVAVLDRAPGGAVLLAVVGVGFVAYGLYCGVRARHARM